MSFFDDDEDTTTVECRFVRESDKAVLISSDGEDVWIPKSCCDDAWERSLLGDEITLEVATWFAEKEGL